MRKNISTGKMKRGLVSRRVPERERESKSIFNKWLVFILLIIFASAILIFLFKSSPPQILSASVYPEKVMPGQAMLIKAEIKDSLIIKNAKASIETDDLPDTTRLLLVDGSIRNGKYEGGWIVHDTSAQKWYNITITATNILGKTASIIIPYQDPTQSHNASEIVGGTFTGNYSFAGGDINIGRNLNVTGNLNVSGNLTIDEGLSISGQSRARANRGTAQTIQSSVSTVVQYNTETFDSQNEYDAVTNFRFTAKEAGYYQVTAAVIFSGYAWAAGNIALLNLFKNGATVSYFERHVVEAAVTEEIGVGGTDLIFLAAGDYIDIRMYHTRGADTNIGANSANNYFAIHKLS